MDAKTKWINGWMDEWVNEIIDGSKKQKKKEQMKCQRRRQRSGHIRSWNKWREENNDQRNQRSSSENEKKHRRKKIKNKDTEGSREHDCQSLINQIDGGNHKIIPQTKHQSSSEKKNKTTEAKNKKRKEKRKNHRKERMNSYLSTLRGGVSIQVRNTRSTSAWLNSMLPWVDRKCRRYRKCPKSPPGLRNWTAVWGEAW